VAAYHVWSSVTASRQRWARPANCHTFRATGITAYVLNGGTLEHAQQKAAYESPRTTKLYDRTSDEITPDEIERIGI
jgi:integrase/recombinase XerD